MSDKTYVPKSIRESAEVRAWLRTQNEFVLQDFADYSHPTAYSGSINLEKAQLADAIRSVLSEIPPPHRRILELYLEHPPREIARRIKWSRYKVYKLIEQGKVIALKLYQQRPAPEPRKKLVYTPAPVRTLAFTLPNGETGKAKLVLFDGEAYWLDAWDRVFPDEIQDILSSLHELEDAFETVEIE